MRWLILSAVLVLVPAVAEAQWTVLPHLPLERRAEMVAALRLELAGRGVLVEPAGPFEPEVSVAQMRELAAAAGATHAVWITFPNGLLAPAEVRVLDVARADAAHGMTPQAWDVVEPRVLAVLVGSLLDAVAMPSAAVAALPPPPSEPSGASAPAPVVPAASTTVDLDATTEGEELSPPSDTRGARRFSFGVGLGLAHRSAPGRPEWVEPQFGGLTFYGRLGDWASIGLRLNVAGIGVSSIEGVLVSGAIGAPSVMLSFREPLGSALMLELGVHAEGGVFFYGRNVAEWSFGVGGGVFVNLDIGAHNALSLDYSLAAFGFADVGAHTWGALTLSHVSRWD